MTNAAAPAELDHVRHRELTAGDPFTADPAAVAQQVGQQAEAAAAETGTGTPT